MKIQFVFGNKKGSEKFALQWDIRNKGEQHHTSSLTHYFLIK